MATRPRGRAKPTNGEDTRQGLDFFEDLLALDTEKSEESTGSLLILSDDELRVLREVLPIYWEQSDAAGYEWSAQVAEGLIRKLGGKIIDD